MPTVVVFMMGAPLGQVVASKLPLWHIDAASGGGIHSITSDDNSTPERHRVDAANRCGKHDVAVTDRDRPHCENGEGFATAWRSASRRENTTLVSLCDRTIANILAMTEPLIARSRDAWTGHVFDT